MKKAAVVSACLLGLSGLFVCGIWIGYHLGLWLVAMPEVFVVQQWLWDATHG